jgi:hypothetical protein
VVEDDDEYVEELGLEYAEPFVLLQVGQDEELRDEE